MDESFSKNDGTVSQSERTILTDDSYALASYKALLDGSNNVLGVTTTHDSKTVCDSDKNFNYKLT